MTRFKEHDLSSDHPGRHQEFGVCATDIDGYPGSAFSDRAFFQSLLLLCWYYSHPSFQTGKNFKLGLESAYDVQLKIQWVFVNGKDRSA